MSNPVLDGNFGLIETTMKLSALREASLAQEIREAGVVQMTSLYMGQSLFICRF